MNETPEPSRNRLATAGFVINCLGAIAFLGLFFGSAGKANNSPASATVSETQPLEGAVSDAIGNAVGETAKEVAPVFFAFMIGGLIWLAGSVCCLIGLIWQPRRMAIAGLLLILITIGGVVVYKQSNSDGQSVQLFEVNQLENVPGLAKGQTRRMNSPTS